MMGERQVDQGALFYEFSLEIHVPADHLLRTMDHFVDLGDVREESTLPFELQAVARKKVGVGFDGECCHPILAYFCCAGSNGGSAYRHGWLCASGTGAILGASTTRWRICCAYV